MSLYLKFTAVFVCNNLIFEKKSSEVIEQQNFSLDDGNTYFKTLIAYFDQSTITLYVYENNKVKSWNFELLSK